MVVYTFRHELFKTKKLIDSLDIALEVMDNLMKRYKYQIVFRINSGQVNMRTRMLRCPCGIFNMDQLQFVQTFWNFFC